MSLLKRSVKKPDGEQRMTEIGDSAVKIVRLILLFILLLILVAAGGPQWITPLLRFAFPP